MTLAADLQYMLSGPGSVEVTADTWGGTFRGIFSKEWVEIPGGYSPTITTATANLPGSYAVGDLVTVGGTQYKLVDYNDPQIDITQLVLALP